MFEVDKSDTVSYQRGGKTYTRRRRREYTDEFKKRIIELHKAGKRRSDLIRDYDLSQPTFDRWLKEYNNSGSFKASDNRTETENELIRLQKEIKQLRMENDILKQAALILGEYQRKQN